MQTKIMVAAAAAVALLAAGKANATVAYDTSLAAPGTYFGGGNPNTHWTTDTENGIEIGLQALLRHVGPVTPTPINSARYYVPLGTSGGVSLWDFAFSFNGGTVATLDNVTTKLSLIDFGDHRGGSFDPKLIGDNDVFGPHGKDSALDNASTEFGFQNAESLSFPGIAAALHDLAFNPNANDTYRLTFTAMQGSQVLGSVTETIIAGTGAVPEPATLSVLAIGCVGLLGIRRRRRQ